MWVPILVGFKLKLIFEFEGFGCVCVMMIKKNVSDQYVYVIDIMIFDCIDEVMFMWLILWFLIVLVKLISFSLVLVVHIIILGDDFDESMKNSVIIVINKQEIQ